MKVTRPALRYYGGKWKLAPWIISHFPPHKNYVEPCGGAASVLLTKPRSLLETYNDLDGAVVNFFRVLRDQPDELARRVRLTPWARAEYELAMLPSDDPVEAARRFFAKSYMSFNGASGDSKRIHGWRHTTDDALRRRASDDLINNDLMAIAERLSGVQIENRDYRFVVQHYDNPRTLIYFDPPYLGSTRTNPGWYKHDWRGEEEHRQAAELLRKCEGFVVVSGYACPLYAELYDAHGWVRQDRKAQTNGGKNRVESIWLSPRTWEVF